MGNDSMRAAGTGKYRLYILAAAFLWGGIGVYFKELSAKGAEPFQIVLIRTAIAALGLGIWILCTDRSKFRIKLKDIWCFIGTGMVSLLLFNWFFFMAIGEVGIAVAGVLLYTAPAFVTVLSAVLFNEKLKLPGWGILAVILLGCTLVAGVIGNISGVSIPGILFGLGSGLGYALYSIFGRYALLKDYSSQTISFYTFLFCALGCIPFAAAVSGSNLPVLAADPSVWMYAAALGILGCLFPYLLYTKGLSGVTGATASMTATLEPVVAALFGVILYKEMLTLWQVSGMVLVLGGIILLSRQGTNNRAAG